MLSKTSPDDVNACLIKIRTFINEQRYTFVPRKKNIETITSLGITNAHVIEIIESLTYQNYFNGPTEDRDRPGTGQCWEFGHNINDADYYIKIKIANLPDNEFAIILSFHKADRPIQYPYE